MDRKSDNKNENLCVKDHLKEIGQQVKIFSKKIWSKKNKKAIIDKNISDKQHLILGYMVKTL